MVVRRLGRCSTVRRVHPGLRAAALRPRRWLPRRGPDEGAAYVKQPGGVGNTEGVMVPNTWYGGSTG